MPLVVVDLRFLDRVWPVAAPLLSPAVDLMLDETDLSVIQDRIRNGNMTLLLWVDNDDQATGAAVVQFINYSKIRTAFVLFMAGDHGLTDDTKAGELKQWCRENGASAIDAWCHKSAARLFRRFGFEERRIVMRAML